MHCTGSVTAAEGAILIFDQLEFKKKSDSKKDKNAVKVH